MLSPAAAASGASFDTSLPSSSTGALASIAVSLTGDLSASPFSAVFVGVIVSSTAGVLIWLIFAVDGGAEKMRGADLNNNFRFHSTIAIAQSAAHAKTRKTTAAVVCRAPTHVKTNNSPLADNTIVVTWATIGGGARARKAPKCNDYERAPARFQVDEALLRRASCSKKVVGTLR